MLTMQYRNVILDNYELYVKRTFSIDSKIKINRLNKSIVWKQFLYSGLVFRNALGLELVI